MGIITAVLSQNYMLQDHLTYLLTYLGLAKSREQEASERCEARAQEVP